jgi:hypothetical protein
VPQVLTQATEVQFASDDPDVSFYVKTASARLANSGLSAHGFTKICTPPCVASMPVGRTEIAVGRSDDRVLSPEHPLTVTGPGKVTGEYHSKTALRVGGLVILLVGEGLCAGFILGSDHQGNNGQNVHSDGLFKAGIGIGLVSGIAGFVMVLQKDWADVSFVPYSAPATPIGREAGVPGGSALDVQGAALRLRF